MNNSENSEKVDATKEKAISIAKKGLNKSLARDIVLKTTETLLPIVFWVGLIVIFFMSFTAGHFGSYGWSIKASIVSFISFLIPSMLAFIVSFYLIYVLKDIKDSLQINKGASNEI